MNPIPERSPFWAKEMLQQRLMYIPSDMCKTIYPKARITHAKKKNSQAAIDRILMKAKKLIGLSSMLSRFSMVRVVT